MLHVKFVCGLIISGPAAGRAPTAVIVRRAATGADRTVLRVQLTKSCVINQLGPIVKCKINAEIISYTYICTRKTLR